MVLAIPRGLYSDDGSSHIQFWVLQLIYNSTYTAHLKFLKAQYCLLNEFGVARYFRDSSWYSRLLKKNKKVLNMCQDSIRWLEIYFFSVRCKKLNLAKRSFSSRAKYVTKQNCLTRGACNKRKTLLKSHFGNGGINLPENPKGPNNSGEITMPTSNQSLVRFNYLFGIFSNLLYWEKILQSIELSEFSFVILKQNQAKLIQLASELAILNMFNHNIESQKLAYSDEYLFSLAFPWLFHVQTGSYIELMLVQNIKTTKSKANFKKLFLSFQRNKVLFFNPNEAINEHSLLSTQQFFKKTNLCRVIRILMELYNHSFWSKLSPREKYFFTKNMLEFTRKEGSFRYINALFDNVNYCKEAKQISISGKTFSLQN
jgi:hypothetical protein